MIKTFARILGSGARVTAAIMLVAATTHGQNFLVDPGFENQTPPGSGGWNLFNGAAFSTNFAHSGTWSMADLALNSVPGSYEEFAATPGSKWELTGFGLTPAQLTGTTAFGILQISYFDSAHNNLGTVETSPGNAKASAQINGSTPAGVWTFLDTGIATAPPTTAFIQAFTLDVDFSGHSQGVYFDDLSLTRVPEPSSVALLGLAALSGIWWRRRF